MAKSVDWYAGRLVQELGDGVNSEVLSCKEGSHVHDATMLGGTRYDCNWVLKLNTRSPLIASVSLDLNLQCQGKLVADGHTVGRDLLPTTESRLLLRVR